MLDVPQRSRQAVAIAASFTAEPLRSPLQFVLGQAGLALAVYFAPYHQVFQELLSPTSVLATNTRGINAVLIRLEDYVRDMPDGDDAPALIRRTLRDVSDALTQYSQRVNIPTILAVLPPSPGTGLLASELEKASTELIRHVLTLSGIVLLSAEEVNQAPTDEQFDQLSDELAHIPFTEQYYASLALAIARKAHAILVPAVKVLALDCDETLWRGVVGEDGVEGIAIPPALARVQQFARDIQAKGVLVCLLSKNTESDVLEVFERRSDMVLRLDDVVAHRINWQSKPRNIADLARVLNLGLDAFVFIDDNPVECALMRAERPQVITLQLPPDDEIESFFSNLWVFDKLKITQEDTRRTSMYRENAARQQFEESATDVAEFIASLEVVIDIAPPDEGEWARVSQLTHRTNQFNFTTIRRNESEMRGLANEKTVLRVRVRDRFGDYGLVGVVIAQQQHDYLAVDTFLLSCRVLGRGVEHAILRHLGELSRQSNLQHVDLRYVPTAKNEPARAFAESVAADFRSDSGGQLEYKIPVDYTCGIAHRPGHDPEAIIEALKAEERKGSSPAPASADGGDRSARYARLARTLSSGRELLRAVRATHTRARSLPGEPAIPVTSTERELLSLWQELLAVEGLGVEDDYFALGGTSLTAAKLFAEIGRRFGTKLPLTTILESSTVRKLGVHLDQRRTTSNCLVELKDGGPRKFFLVHDGDGETLLYLNLARGLPDDFSVLGIEPRRIIGVPLADVTIEDMASFYISEIKKEQQTGPYLLGGMCAGGVIAYEMAVQLADAGERVDLVAILDAAAPRAAKRLGRVADQRFKRLNAAVANAQAANRSAALRALSIGRTISRKVFNTLKWEILSRAQRVSTRLRFWTLRRVLAQKTSWPTFLPELTVREIYDSAESNYGPKMLNEVPILLVRAQVGEGNDTPYHEIYLEDAFGWESLVADLEVVDVDGGHSSMLQEPFVRPLTAKLLPHLTRSPQQSSVRSLELATK